MRRTKFFLLSALCTLFFAATANAQELINQATEFFNKGAEAVQAKDWATAIDQLYRSIAIASELGEEGESIVMDAKDLIPSLHLYYGQELAQASKTEDAIDQLNKAIDTALEYDDPGNTVKTAKGLINQLHMRTASNLLNDKQYDDAITAFNLVLADDPDNGTVHMYMGIAYAFLNKEDDAIAAYEKAIELGNKDAEKQLANIYLKKAVGGQGAKKWDDVYKNAKKVLEIDPNNVNGNKLLGAASIELKKWDDAIAAYEKVLPSESNPDGVIFNLAKAYEAKGNKAKACENYKKIVTNPTFKAYAEAKVKELCS
ncbi:MAG: tetratricopeptide repeat protein [Bacteroidetes bacterium]|nr:tetratricopeptide repeat protein [Bacteroidota bacterium]